MPDDMLLRLSANCWAALTAPLCAAAEAGLALDDEVLAIDGEPVAKLTLEAIRTRLKASGKRVRLEVKRADATRAAELALRTLI